MNDRNMFWHLAAADRETLLTGVLAWLLDPLGSHGLGRRFLTLVWERVAMGRELRLTRRSR